MTRGDGAPQNERMGAGMSVHGQLLDNLALGRVLDHQRHAPGPWLRATCPSSPTAQTNLGLPELGAPEHSTDQAVSFQVLALVVPASPPHEARPPGFPCAARASQALQPTTSLAHLKYAACMRAPDTLS